MTLRSSEWISLAYFVYLAVLAGWAPVPVSRRRRVIAVAAAVGVVILLLPRVPAGVVTLIARDWICLLYVGLGYWLPALLVRAPDERLEGFLADLDRRWLPRIGFRDAGLRTAGRLGEPPSAESRGTSTGRWSRLFVELAELSYLSCYLVVPTGLACLYLAGFGAEADRFWVAVLLAVLPCYGLLPWLPTRPPRVVNGTASGRSAIRTLNLRVLEHGSVQFNTFPSGHVASAVATVLSVTVALPAGGLLLAPIAVGIAVGSVIGRYHYLADVIAGAAIALAAFGISRAI